MTSTSTSPSFGGVATVGGSSGTTGGLTGISGGTSFGGNSASGQSYVGGNTGTRGGATAAGGASSAGGSGAFGGTSAPGGGSAAGGSGPFGGTSTSGGFTAWQPGCLLRLGGLPEQAPSSVGGIGDFNKDGLLDVVLGPVSGSTIRVLLGRGNGVYGAATTFTSGGSARAIAVGDLDGDGNLDIAARNSDAGTISILSGSGNGNFELTRTVSASSDNGSGFTKQNLVLADVTGDGRLDLLSAHWDQTISIAVGTSSGTFIRLSPINVGREVTELAVADLNGDNILDIVVNSGWTNKISVLLGTGGGTFASKVDYPVVSATAWQTASLAIGDIDKDGRADVIVGNNAGASIAVLMNKGNGTLASPVATNVSGSFNAVNNVQLADLEGDGDLDLMVNVSGDGALYYLWNNGTGAFTTITRDYVANAGIDIKFGDSNQDGITDLFLFGDKFLTLLGKGAGKFESQKYLLLSNATANPRGVAVGNFDGTGYLDVALANETASSASVFLLDINGAYSVPTSYAQGLKPSLLRAADLTGDGKADLLNLNYGGTMNVLKNNGTGAFTVLTPFNVLAFKQWFDLKDVNEDGTLDIVMLSGTSACVYAGTGTGAFGTCSPFTVSNGASMEAMVLGDVNGDRHLDVVANGNSSLNVWFGKGDGTFTSSGFYASGTVSGTTTMALADLDEDRDLDLILMGNPSGVLVWLGNGDGSFKFAKTYGAAGTIQRIETADMNRDGHVDRVIATGDGNSIVVLLGNGDGTLNPTSFTYPGGKRPTDLAIADVNSDGWLDVAAPGYDSGSGGVLFGGPPVCPTK